MGIYGQLCASLLIIICTHQREKFIRGTPRLGVPGMPATVKKINETGSVFVFSITKYHSDMAAKLRGWKKVPRQKNRAKYK